MKSFEHGVLDHQPITPELLRTIRLLGEYKGKEALYQQQSPQILETLRRAALIQSTESSNRIEGVIAPPDRIRDLVSEKTMPRNRSEQEIAGYRNVLNTVHANALNMPFTPGVVLQLHRDLYQFLPAEGGHWKVADNDIVEKRPDGTVVVRFRPLPAHRTPDAIQELHHRFNALWDEERYDPLILIPTYVLDFLCIHPFQDGNGRMVRLITLWLLYRAGLEVGRYIGLEKRIEDTKDSYYDSLYASSQGWHEARHSLLPWWEYFLGVMLLGAYREFEQRVGHITTARGAKHEMVLEAVRRLPEQFRYDDVERTCPGVSRPTINRALRELREQGEIRCLKPGRDAVWVKIQIID